MDLERKHDVLVKGLQQAWTDYDNDQKAQFFRDLEMARATAEAEWAVWLAERSQVHALSADARDRNEAQLETDIMHLARELGVIWRAAGDENLRCDLFLHVRSDARVVAR